jgi:hypothetical protein
MNPVQFSSTNPTRPSIKTSNFYIGTSGPYGPTSVTDFYSGITPPSGEYTVYQDKPTLGPSIRIFDGTTIYLFLKFGIHNNEDRNFQQTFQTASVHMIFV